MSPESMISNSNVAAVVTDPTIVDNPIICCNDRFVALSGYPREEIIGRNCRFLRGKDTEADCTEALRLAVMAPRPALVELLNYRKDGTAFRNAVMIAPLFDDAGDVRYFLGSQMAIEPGSAPRQKEATQRIARLTPRQRQILEGLARGRLNKQLAFDLGLKERTIKMHRAAVLRNLGVATNAEAIRLAIEAGF
jgi:PAS domain S-box-containing protein